MELMQIFISLKCCQSFPFLPPLLVHSIIMVLSSLPSLNTPISDLSPDGDVVALQAHLTAASLEFDISTGGVDLQLGVPVPQLTVDGGMGLPPMVATPTGKTIDDGLVETQSGKSVGQLDISKDLRFAF